MSVCVVIDDERNKTSPTFPGVNQVIYIYVSHLLTENVPSEKSGRLREANGGEDLRIHTVYIPLTHPSVAKMQARASSLCANVMWALTFPGRDSDVCEDDMAICAIDGTRKGQGIDGGHSTIGINLAHTTNIPTSDEEAFNSGMGYDSNFRLWWAARKLDRRQAGHSRLTARSSYRLASFTFILR